MHPFITRRIRSWTWHFAFKCTPPLISSSRGIKRSHIFYDVSLHSCRRRRNKAYRTVAFRVSQSGVILTNLRPINPSLFSILHRPFRTVLRALKYPEFLKIHPFIHTRFFANSLLTFLLFNHSCQSPIAK